MPQPPSPRRGAAWFFDFDGTLADIAPTPDGAALLDGLLPLLARLPALDVAVAIVSGRPLAEIDALLAPLRLPAAGVHGAERRDAAGQLHRLPQQDLSAALAPIQALCRREPALRCEIKPGAVALHYRLAPELAGACLAAMSDALALVDGMALLRGKMVIELKPRAADKGRALRAFLAEPPFTGRQPWYFGDDATDEPAFAAAQDLGGVAVKLGEGASVATYRLADPAALRLWLVAATERLAVRDLPSATARTTMAGEPA